MREGYARAERMLAGYRDPPGPLETLLAQCDRLVADLRAWVRF